MKEIQTDSAWGLRSLLSQAVRAGDTLYISGQVPRHADGSLVSGDFEAEVRRVFDNITAVVVAAGGSLRNVCKVTAYLAAPELFEQFNAVYLTYFDYEPRPARTTVCCQLPKPFLRVEVDAIAWLRPE